MNLGHEDEYTEFKKSTSELKEGMDEDELMMQALDAGAEDMQSEEDSCVILTARARCISAWAPMAKCAGRTCRKPPCARSARRSATR